MCVCVCEKESGSVFCTRAYSDIRAYLRTGWLLGTRIIPSTSTGTNTASSASAPKLKRLNLKPKARSPVLPVPLRAHSPQQLRDRRLSLQTSLHTNPDSSLASMFAGTSRIGDAATSVRESATSSAQPSAPSAAILRASSHSEPCCASAELRAAVRRCSASTAAQL